MNTISTLSAFRIGKLTERVGRLERALIEERAQRGGHRGEDGNRRNWYLLSKEGQDHYRTLAENELIREGLVRPRNVREMEVRGNGQTAP